VNLQISVLLLVLNLSGLAQVNYHLQIRSVDKDTVFLREKLGIQTAFPSQADCEDYISRLPDLLNGKGYVTASIDSFHFDTASAYMVLFTGEAYKWAVLDISKIEPSALSAAGWRESQFSNKLMDFSQLQGLQNGILNYYENSGHPFARIYLDSIKIEQEKVYASLNANKGPLYKIDSIRLYGNARISNDYLQRYLELPNGSIYSKEKLQAISKKIKLLPYVEEEYTGNLSLLGTGSVLNLYLKQRRSSQVNVLIGFLPNNDQLSSKKLLITGEANIHLRNALGAGETIGLNWQQLQVKSQHLSVLYEHPYIFHSPIGFHFGGDIFRKDTTFVNINFQVGAQYRLGAAQTGKLFLQRFQTIVNGINKTLVLQTRSLPPEADISVTNLGLDYDYNNTDYRLNPRKGNELMIITTIGSKEIRKNSQVTEIKDPGDPGFNYGSLYDTVKLKTYQLRIRTTLAKYFPLGQRSTVKTAVNGGFLQSGNIFRNELFQIGGFKLLRGFDEESQYLSQFAIATLEFRYLVGQNSFFYVLADGGWGKNKSRNTNLDYTYLGSGLGLAFETKAGIFNLAWAIGKRNDTEFNLRQSKIHVGFVNYF
jgi:outer membrane protein assembly factor BamA